MDGSHRARPLCFPMVYITKETEKLENGGYNVLNSLADPLIPKASMQRPV